MRKAHSIEQVRISAGEFEMGDAKGDRNLLDGEGPVHAVKLDSFDIDATCVTNHDFSRFVEDSGYITEAEAFGFSAVFRGALKAGSNDLVGATPGTSWWIWVKAADWRRPGGRHSGIDDILDHPVVHVSWNDAVAYCEWADRRLPTEAEWERASRGTLSGARFPWGDELLDNSDRWRTNIWQGAFPKVNTLQDGWLTTAPVRWFEPNDFGMWQTVGNVWEWCSDWFNSQYYSVSPASNPTGPENGDRRVIRGGSYLCHSSYCNRYRNSARSSNTPDSSSANLGFRTVAKPVE